MLFGVGVGWLKEEGEIAGNWPARYALLGEMVRAMKELWTKEVAEFHGELIDFPPVCSMPHPKQKPHPPVLVGGGVASLNRVVAYGDGWCPGFLPPEELGRALQTLRERMSVAGRDFSKLDITVMVGVSERSPIREILERYEAAGAGRVVLCVNRPGTPDEVSDFQLVMPGEADAFLDAWPRRSSVEPASAHRPATVHADHLPVDQARRHRRAGGPPSPRCRPACRAACCECRRAQPSSHPQV